ncbi:hypothetical protein D0862_01508 [Hortaea werneckii]|uniref:Uncharacterized protein n=1 Tax=Hortaea werneckii TaxID=91943 RepID=A0A3M7HR57_HORWE|nr:hypothetical protein D0862_01508 [Hortaea werneckii]
MDSLSLSPDIPSSARLAYSMDRATGLPNSPRHGQDFSVRSSESLWRHFITLLLLLLGPLRILLDTVLAYRSVYTLSVHDPGRSSSLENVQSSAPHHQVIGVIKAEQYTWDSYHMDKRTLGQG